MKEKDQVAALAELDGCPSNCWWCNTCEKWVPPNEVRSDETHDTRVTGCGEGVDSSKPYTTSYDAIIPLIQKQPLATRDRIATKGGPISFMATPAQLAEKLLRATGKWKE